ncbi:MAG TPA: hypothetical protein VHM20_07115 [Gammaproteobacteria bacterium]|jgi:hypothetical protein|nr:hypothetical protein [Gammaproteobacteria bacterium]
MFSESIQKLANKFIDTHFQKDKLEKQKEMFESFYYDNLSQLKAILNEMSGDLWLLKEKELPLDLRQLLSKIFQQLVDLYKEIDPQEPYSGTLKLINFVNSKSNKSILENLDFLIQKHLEKNQIDFYRKNNLKQVSVLSISHLLQLIPQLHQFILDNPSLEDITQFELSKLIEESEPASGPEDSTKAI